MATSSVAKSVSEYQIDQSYVCQSYSSYLLTGDMPDESSLDQPVQPSHDDQKPFGGDDKKDSGKKSSSSLESSVSHYALDELRDLSALPQEKKEQQQGTKSEEKSRHGDDHQGPAKGYDNRPHKSDSDYFFDRD